MSSEILEKQHFSTIFRQLGLLAAATPPAYGCYCQKKHLPAGTHHAPEGRPSSKTEPKKVPNMSSEILEKQHFSTILGQLVLLAAATPPAYGCHCQKNTCQQEITMPLKNDLVRKQRQKSA